MIQKKDSFSAFVARFQANWHIYTALGTMGVFLIVAGADARSAIGDQGSRLLVVESKLQNDSDRIATIDERSRLTLQYVQQIDSKLDDLLQHGK